MSARRLVAVVMLAGMAPVVAYPQDEGRDEDREEEKNPWSVLRPQLTLPTAGGASSGEGGPTRLDTNDRDVSAARFGVTKDLPGWIREVMGREKSAADEPKPGDRRITWAPYLTVSPLVGTGFGIGLAGTRQRGEASTTRLSTFSGNVLFTTQDQFSATMRTNVNLPGGDWNLVGNWRWSWFPSPTWGIGGNTPDSDETTIQYRQVRLYEIVNRRVAENLYVGGGYRLDYYYDLKDEAAGTGRETDFQSYPYGTGGRSLNSGLVLSVLYDSRDSPVFATRGVYGSFTYAVAPEALGSDTTWQSGYADVRGYLRVAPRAVLGLWSYAWFNAGEVPYLALPSNGNDPDARSARGYIQGRHISKAMLYGEAELRFAIWEWLGGVASVNVHSVSEPDARGVLQDEPRFRYWWPSVVLGTRILLVKATHSNVCVDFAWGKDGQSGIYFNFSEAF